MKTLILDIPDTVPFDDNEAKMAIASRLFEKGKLSLGQAAQLVGLSKGAFLELIATYGVSVFSQTPEELDLDVKNAEDYNNWYKLLDCSS